MSQNLSSSYIRSTSVFFIITIIAVAAVIIVHAQSTTVFSQTFGSVSAVNTTARSITISYPQPAIGACPKTPSGDCGPGPSGRSSDTITQDQILVINAMGWAVSDITSLKVGDGVTVYLRLNVPYAIKDGNLIPPGCDPATGVCTGAGTITPTPGGTGGGQPPTQACTQEARLCPDGSYVGRTGPNCAFAACPGTIGGGQPPIGQCVQIQTFPPQTICPANIQNDLSSGVQSGEVVTLQAKLQVLGYFPNTAQPTGYFGSVTKQAVIQYQAANGLPQTGYVGPMTRKALGY